MSGHKRAAAALHGMSAADRQWMLQQMSEQDQAQLQAYLQELDALGFQGQVELLQPSPQPQPLRAAPERKQEPAMPAAPLSHVDQIAQAQPQQILACLKDEPASLIARVLQMQAWPWQDAMLMQMDVRLRLAVQRLQSNGTESVAMSAASKLDACLLDALAERLSLLSMLPSTAPLNPPQSANQAATKPSRLGQALSRWSARWKR